jgi:hypothetical protein
MVCLPKQVGGMSVTNIKFHNHALLTKWIVKLYTDTSCLWTTFVINIYSKGRSGRGPLVLKKRDLFLEGIAKSTVNMLYLTKMDHK